MHGISHTDRVTFRNARIDWGETGINRRLVRPEPERQNLVWLRGLSGSTPDNENTTLGRGRFRFLSRDFAHCLKAQKVTVWKMFRVLWRLIPAALRQYRSFWGTLFPGGYWNDLLWRQGASPQNHIKPLQNRQIPLIVRSFLEPEAPGYQHRTRSMWFIRPIIIYWRGSTPHPVVHAGLCFYGSTTSGWCFQYCHKTWL